MGTHEPGSADAERLDEIFDSLQPRMRAARGSHLRRLLAGALVVPILVIGATAAALSVGGSTPDEVSTAEGVADSSVASDRSADGGDSHDPADGDTTGGGHDAAQVGDGTGRSAGGAGGSTLDGDDSAETGDTTADADRVEIPLADVAVVVVESDGEDLWIGFAEVHEWWEPDVTVLTGQTVAASVSNDGVVHHVEAFVTEGGGIGWETWTVVDGPEPTPEPSPTPAPEPDPEPTPSPDPEPEVDRVEIPLGDVAVVVVEREGDTLWIDIVEVHEWWEPVVVTSTGPVVSAYVANDGVEHHVEAFVTEGGGIGWETWTTETPFFDQWIEVPDVGAVKVLVEGNTIRVSETESSEGFRADVEVGFADGGDPVVVAFRGEGVTVVVRAWPGESEATYAVEEVT